MLLPVVLALALVAAVAFLLNRSGGMSASLAGRGAEAEAARYVAEAGLARMYASVQARNCTGYVMLNNVAFGTDEFTAMASPAEGSPVTLQATAATAKGAQATLTRSVTAHQIAIYTMTLQPGPAGMDTHVDAASGASNFGTAPVLRMGSTQRPLLQFDLTQIPAKSYIQSATLLTYATSDTSASGEDVAAMRLTRAWTEGTMNGTGGADGATWSDAAPGVPWSVQGGDHDPVAAASAAWVLGSGWKNWDVSALVQRWVDTTRPNHGLVLVPTAGVSGVQFVSGDDAANVSLWPRLVVQFRPPCGWNPPASTQTVPAVADTWIDEDRNGDNHGGAPTMQIGAPDKHQRSLLLFNLSGIAAGAKIVSATVRVYVSGVASPRATTLYLHQATDYWVEGSRAGSGTADGATWNRRDATNNWTAGNGGSYGATPVASKTINAVFSSGWVEFDVTALAQQWIDGASVNQGVLLRSATSAVYTLHSRTAAGNRPELVIQTGLVPPPPEVGGISPANAGMEAAVAK